MTVQALSSRVADLDPRRRARYPISTGHRPMNAVSPQRMQLNVGAGNSVSALLLRPSRASACFVFAHGAGAGMTHPFMERVADGLCDRDVATLRYQFPYMEHGS